MELFLKITALVFFVFGMMLLFSPHSVKKISDFLNKQIFTIEGKLEGLHRPIGVVLVILGIILIYIVFVK